MKKYREGIDRIDRQLIKLLEERFELVEKIGIKKKELGLPVVDRKREKEIISKRQEQSSSLSRGFVSKLFRMIFREAYRKEE